MWHGFQPECVMAFNLNVDKSVYTICRRHRRDYGVMEYDLQPDCGQVGVHN